MKIQLHSVTVSPRLPCGTVPNFSGLVARALFAALAFAIHATQAAVIEGWIQRYNGPANRDDGAGAIAVDGRGDVVVTGVSYTSETAYQYYTAKYAAATGALLWEKRSSVGGVIAVEVDDSGDVIVTGSHAFTGFNGDYYTAKYSGANGALLWQKIYNGPSNDNDSPIDMALDSSGNVVVTGLSAASNFFTTDYYTAKYAATNGSLLWEKRYNGPANSYDQANSVAVDASGDVVVTGDSQGDFYTAKYAGTNGALIWEKRYNGPANRGDSGIAVALDTSGNVVVTGISGNFVGSHDFCTVKYAAANGALLWEKRYVGPGTFDDARAVAVDANGDVFVTGGSDNSGNTSDFYTIKYAGADGALLWEKRYNGPTNKDDDAYAVAVDGSGDVVVVGISESDFYTIKYAGTNGTLLWEKRYNGSANGNEFFYSADSLALGPNGMLAIAAYSEGTFNSRTTYDFATVIYWENLPPISIAADGSGGYVIRTTGTAGSIYELQRAAGLTDAWLSNTTMTATAPGVIEFHDTNAPSGAAFYRAVQR
ncbi:MAG TPA: PQQ-binding-like beta-propeller repeat protein [Verrucomicrobiae bacterium]